MKYIILTLFLALAVVACTAETTQPAEQNDPTALQPNQVLVCDGENQHVEGTACVCDDGFKVCNRACIPNDQCCSDSDCASGICDAGVCTDPCADKLCKINEVCSSETGECACKPGTKYCGKQGRCIENTQCCDNADCNSDRQGRRCVDIVTSFNICVNDGQFCKWVRQERPAQLALDEKGFEVYVEELYEGDMIDVTVNGNLFEHQAIPSTVQLGEDDVTFDEFKVTGGQCQEYS